MEMPHPAQHELHTYESSDQDLGAESALEEIAIRPRPRRVDETEMDITPMIDMTFLLLIFFILTSKIDTQGEVELPKTMFASSVVVDQSAILTVAQGGPDGTARVFKGDGTDPANQLQSPNLADQEEEIAEWLESQLDGVQKRYVLIKASKDVKHREVARVAEAATLVEAVEGLYVAVVDGGQ